VHNRLWVRTGVVICALVLVCGCTVQKPAPRVTTSPAPTTEFASKESALQSQLEGARKTNDVNSEVYLLTQLADLHYTAALTSYHQKDVNQHVADGQAFAQLAVQRHEAGKLPRESELYKRLLHRLALLQEKMGHYDESERRLKEALAIKPKPDIPEREVYSMKVDLARMYIEHEKYQEAVAVLMPLFAQYRANPQIISTPMELVDMYVKAEENLGHEEKVRELRTWSKAYKKRRAAELEREAANEIRKELNTKD
jgi:tetratricopeptide (TPR) repeat protein